jgi:hypothetical protein
MKLVNGLIERKSINDSLALQILSKVDRSIASHEISIILDQIYQIFQHFILRALNFNRINIGISSSLIIRMMFRQIWVHPNLHLSFLREENHFFSNIEKSNLFIEYFKPLQAALVEIELIAERNVIDLLQSQLNLADIQQAIVNGRTELIHGGICEILDLVNIGTGAIGLHLFITQDL